MSAFILTLIASFVLCAAARPALRRLGVIDRPNARSSHSVPTVRGLGVGIVVSVILVWFVGGLFGNPVAATLLVSGLVLSIVSFVDDMKPISPRVRFSVHALAAIATLIALLCTSRDRSWDGWTIAALPVGFLFVAGYTNAFNFMDGINGIAGFQGLLTGAGSIAVLLCSGVSQESPVVAAFATLAGASAGFLPHNFPKARGFMGDVASATLGFWLAGCTLWAAGLHGAALLVPLSLLHANFILDTGITLIRRARRGERLGQAHRDHFYQRMVRAGASHTLTTTLEAAGIVISIFLMLGYVQSGLLLKGLAVGMLFALWTSFFVYAERRFQKSEKQSRHG